MRDSVVIVAMLFLVVVSSHPGVATYPVTVIGGRGEQLILEDRVMGRLIGADYRRLIPSSALVGGCFLIWSDMAARTVLAPAEFPIGVITAFFGAPFFLYFLKTRGASLLCTYKRETCRSPIPSQPSH